MRIVLWAAGAVLLALILAGGVIYFLASRVPGEYRYRPLTPEEQRQTLNALVNHILDFGNQAGAGQPFTWTITDRQATDYLASADAVADLLESPRYPSVEMERAGFVAPAVAMREGVLTLMTRLKSHDKIVSLDLAFEFDGQGNVTARTVGVRIGVMPVPGFLVDAVQRQVRRRLAEELAKAENIQGAHIGPVSVGRFAGLLGRIVQMLDGQHVRPEIVWPLGKHRVRIERIEVTPGQVTLHVVPAERGRVSSAPAPGGGG